MEHLPRGLKLYTSNRLEILADRLAEVLDTPLASPFDPEIIVVQSKGMERWVSMQLSLRHGICANCWFPFPNRFLEEMFRRVLSKPPGHSPFEPRILTWEIMKCLRECIHLPGFEKLRTYLEGQPTGLKAFQLSARIADTFDQYLIFRPKMIFDWENGQHRNWQARLWRRIVKEIGGAHRAGLAKDFLRAVRDVSTGVQGLPQRVSVFGISALPRFHMEIFAALATKIQVNLFLMNPCKEYWGDILSEREIGRRRQSKSGLDMDTGTLHMEKGNSLLASMGAVGRDFFDMIMEFEGDDSSCFEDPGDPCLLLTIQSDIMNLRDARYDRQRKRTVAPEDDSIDVHVCHSPMREIEVLQDQLLAMFEADPQLSPKDVLVMTPDIEVYAPYIQAVFDLPPSDPRRIPFSVADQGIRKDSEIGAAFLSVLDLGNSRFEASKVMALLEVDAVRRRFELSVGDIKRIRSWIKDTGIRWAVDEKNREELGLPPFSENTWRAGLERLLLGYALPGEGSRVFGECLPFDHVEGSDALLLGKFCQFTETLFNLVRSLSRPRTPAQWARTLGDILEQCFLPHEAGEREAQVIRRILYELGTVQEMIPFDLEVDIKVIRWHLTQLLQKEVLGFGFMTGGVTFCAMLPMRSIPFKVICLVGMNHDTYPRDIRPLGFDLIAQHPMPGDRSKRKDDRYLFLETLLSARQKFYISYVGQSLRDNSPVPPSVLVSELLDYIGEAFELEQGSLMDRIVTRHRLQAFSPAYFKKKGRLFSYSPGNLEAARCLLQEREDPRPFITSGLSQPDETWRNVDIEDLCRFFGNPARFLLRRRLGIYLEEARALLQDREPFQLEPLEMYPLQETLVRKRLGGEDLKDLYVPMRASGSLPHGTVGMCLFEGMRRGVEDFVENLRNYMAAPPREPIEVTLAVSGFSLRGRVRSIYGERFLHYRYAKIKPRDQIRAWIYHLVLNSIPGGGHPRTSLIAGLDSKRGQELQWAVWEYPPVSNSDEILGTLLRRYWKGLCLPLPFFPLSSWQYASMKLARGKDPEEAVAHARKQWTGSRFQRGECQDLYYQLCFGGADPFGEEFQRIAEEVFGPILDIQRELKAQ